MCNEQRELAAQWVCHCQGQEQRQQGNVTQCNGCHNWYHQDCWGDHVDIGQDGPSMNFIKGNDADSSDQDKEDNSDGSSSNSSEENQSDGEDRGAK